MIAAVYARKSTEQTGVADDQKSVARQVEHASTYARTKGWTVAPASVFVDDALAARQFVIRVRAEIEGLPSGGIVSGAATGGLVGRGRVIPFALGGPVFSPMGTDTVPAMLTPGEIVLNAAQQRRVAGAMGGSITLNVSVDASGNDPDAVARKVSDAIMMKLRREQRLNVA